MIMLWLTKGSTGITPSMDRTMRVIPIPSPECWRSP